MRASSASCCEWIYFLKHEEIKDEFSAQGLAEAKQKLDVMKLPANERRAYQRYLDDLSYQASMVESSYGIGRKEGIEEGREEGRVEGKLEGRVEGKEEGREEATIAMVRALKQQGVPIENIAFASGLSIEAIKQL